MKKIVILLLLSIFFTNCSATDLTENIRNNEESSKFHRILHFTVQNISLEDAYKLIDFANQEGFSSVQILLSNGINFENAPWKPLANAWSRSDFISWVKYVKSHNLDVIPEIKLLTHQEKFFQDKYPRFMFNKSTYDPSNEEALKIVFTFLDEIIEIIQPKAIHIGHDEVAGHRPYSAKQWLRPGEKMLPADLFLKNVKYIYAYLKHNKVETWMWGDMLISSNEFPNMLAKHLHGNSPGYGKNLRDQLPRDIVICDWHYFDEQTEFPSLSTLQQEGFRVIATTWKNEKTIRNFSRYAKNHNAYGMMATTWFHVQRNEMELVKWIIQTSGLLFQNPDATVLPQPK